MTRPAPPPPVLRLPSATLQVCATKENDTPRGIANRCGCKLDDLLRENEEAWPDLQGSSRMLKDTQLVLPPVRDVVTGPDALPPVGMPRLADKIEVEVEEAPGDPAVWKKAEVRRMRAGARFSVCVDGDEAFIEEYGMEDEGSEWRRVGAPAASLAVSLAGRRLVMERRAEHPGSSD